MASRFSAATSFCFSSSRSRVRAALSLMAAVSCSRRIRTSSFVLESSSACRSDSARSPAMLRFRRSISWSNDSRSLSRRSESLMFRSTSVPTTCSRLASACPVSCFRWSAGIDLFTRRRSKYLKMTVSAVPRTVPRAPAMSRIDSALVSPTGKAFQCAVGQAREGNTSSMKLDTRVTGESAVGSSFPSSQTASTSKRYSRTPG